MKRVRVHANLGFWKPCLIAISVREFEIPKIDTAWLVLMGLVPGLQNKLYWSVDGVNQ